MPRSTMLITCTLVALATLAAAAVAQSSPPGRGEGESSKKSPPASQPDSGLLAGPRVEQEATEQTRGRPATPNNPGQRRPEPLPPRAWLNAVRQLDLTAEQQKEMTAIVSEMQEAVRTFQQEHGEEARELQTRARAAREAGKEPDPKVRESLQKIEAESPKPIDFQRRIWALLSTEQQDSLRVRVAELEKQMKERGRDGARRRAGENSMQDTMTGGEPDMMKPADKKTPAAGDAMKDSGDDERPGIRERLRQRRRGGETLSMHGLDDPARRRTEFLLAHQASDCPGHAPTPQERSFRFPEDEAR